MYDNLLKVNGLWLSCGERTKRLVLPFAPFLKAAGAARFRPCTLPSAVCHLSGGRVSGGRCGLGLSVGMVRKNAWREWVMCPFS